MWRRVWRWHLLGVVIIVVAIAAWRWEGAPSSVEMRSSQSESMDVESTMQVERFRYSEMQHGMVIYRLSGEQMHDAPASLGGGLRIAAVRVMKLKKVQLELLQPKVAGWLLTAEHGEMVSGSRQLSLWGEVRGWRKQGGSLRAGRVLVDPLRGVIKLRDGFVLDVGQRHERGITMELGQ